MNIEEPQVITAIVVQVENWRSPRRLGLTTKGEVALEVSLSDSAPWLGGQDASVEVTSKMLERGTPPRFIKDHRGANFVLLGKPEEDDDLILHAVKALGGEVKITARIQTTS